MKYQDTTLLKLCTEVTIYGVLLSIITPLTSHELDVGAIVIFLACVCLFKLFFPVEWLDKFFWGRVIAAIFCIISLWSLFYQAQNTRIGWYRFHVLQTRMQELVSKAPSYVIVSDNNGYITCVSDNISGLIGWNKGELLGKHIHMLMRNGPAMRHDKAFTGAVARLHENSITPDAGWTLQGVMTIGIKHKNGHIVPVKAYAGGIRWSQDIHFDGDTDMFAVFVPVSADDARKEPTNISDKTHIQVAPNPPIIMQGQQK